MNKQKIAILALSLSLMVTACKKNDLQSSQAQANATASTAAAAATSAKTSEFKAVSNWNNTKQDKFTSFYSKVADSSITSSVVSKGMILVYKKSGNTVNALPFDEKGTNDIFWYYQAAQGSLLISSDVYGTSQTLPAGQSFAYFVITPEQLSTLVANGQSKAALLNLSYDKAVALLNK
jgi:hypothetical protein